MTVVEEIVAERQRQVKEEGFTAQSDDDYNYGELARAAAVYTAHAGFSEFQQKRGFIQQVWDMMWPWPAEWWKPGEPRRDLIKAAALIIAEIERIDRAYRQAGR